METQKPSRRETSLPEVQLGTLAREGRFFTFSHHTRKPIPVMKTKHIILNLTLLVSVMASATRSRAGDENWDARFNLPPDQGVNGWVYAVAVSGSNVYVGGSFTKAGTVNATNIAKWNGSSWSALGDGVNDTVYAIAGDYHGGVYVGGRFWQAGSTDASYIAHWDGTNWSALGSGPYNGTSGYVYAIGINGPFVVVGGLFTAAGGVSANFIAKWDGQGWSALGSGVNGTVYAIAYIGRWAFVGGDFTTVGGRSANHIARCVVDGGGWSVLGGELDNGVNGAVRAIAVGPNLSDVYIGGDFTAFATGWGASHIAKYAGGSWYTLTNGWNGVDGVVRALAMSGTNLYVGGDFMTAGLAVANRLARWDGSWWYTLGHGADYSVRAIAASGTNLYVGGSFGTVGGVNARQIAKCNWDGSRWSTLGGPGLGLNNNVCAIAMPVSDLYAGGKFTAAGTANAMRIAKFDGDGWWELGRLSNSVTAIAGSLPNLYVGGWFSHLGYVAEWSTLYDPLGEWWSLGGGVNNAVNAMAGYYGNVYVGGDFTGWPPYIRKWDGSSWSALGSGVDSPVNAIAVWDPDVYVGGEFWKASGVVVNHIAHWDGSSWSALGSGVNDWVYAVALGHGVYVGGHFTMAGGVAATNIARWDGTNWSALGSGVSGGVQTRVNAIAIQGNNVYVGGDFTMAGGVAATNIAKWNGSSWSALGSGVNGVVYALDALGFSYGVCVGGAFTMAGGKPSSHFGIWFETAVPVPYLRAMRTSTNTVCVWWPVPDTSWQLEATTNLASPGSVWEACSYTTNGANCEYIESPPTGKKFYRLKK